jgi:hypothetical protein
MGDGRVGAGGRLVCAAAVIAGSGCLTRQRVEATDASSGASSTTTTSGADETSGSSTMEPILMTTTETPDTTATTAAPSCVDGEVNQDETDVDCGGRCSGCEAGQTCDVDADCASQACVAGTCVAPTCFDDDDCASLADACNTAACGPEFLCVRSPTNEGDACDDGVACSTVSRCTDGACSATEMVDCTAFDSLCTAGVCDPASGACLAVDTPDGTPCDDANGCTTASTCMGGSCVTAEAGALLFEDFSGAAPGWTPDKLWAIGPAVASPTGSGGADPDSDHSPGDDDRLAGLGIGVLDTSTSHDPWCLTSPAVDTTSAAPSLHVSFWRHLHTTGQPKVINTVEVWDGSAWVVLEAGYPGIVDDAAWTFQTFDASGHQALDFRLRICVERLAGAPNFASWSVDDVTFAATPCTP